MWISAPWLHMEKPLLREAGGRKAAGMALLELPSVLKVLSLLDNTLLTVSVHKPTREPSLPAERIKNQT